MTSRGYRGTHGAVEWLSWRTLIRGQRFIMRRGLRQWWRCLRVDSPPRFGTRWTLNTPGYYLVQRCSNGGDIVEDVDVDSGYVLRLLDAAAVEGLIWRYYSSGELLSSAMLKLERASTLIKFKDCLLWSYYPPAESSFAICKIEIVGTPIECKASGVFGARVHYELWGTAYSWKTVFRRNATHLLL